MNETKKNSKIGSILDSTGARFAIIAILILLLNIPLGMVNHITSSRGYLFDNTVNEISSDWGGRQTIIAPIMIVPIEFTEHYRTYDEKKKIYENQTNSYQKNYMFLPENLDIKAVIEPQMRHRGIFDVLVHSTKVNITGNFQNVDFSDLSGNYKILWKKATLSMGLNPSSIRGDIKLELNGVTLFINPGSNISEIDGISANVDLSNGKLSQKFDISLQFNGSGDISFAPLGQKNNFEVNSTWAHPEFKNTFRPDSPEISEKGFNAKWNIPYIARDYPQVITDTSVINKAKYKLATVALFDTMPVYKKTSRLSDYGIMFITLTFVMMFLFERKLKQKIHYIQYAIVGLAISLFFLTVMALSEYMMFGLSYAIASLIVIMMISLYIYAAIRNRKTALAGGVIMAVLYSILYLMLSEANYALLIGTFILLTTIAAVMWETRNINQIEE